MRVLIKKLLREETENTVLVVFGGLRKATAAWMLEQIPERIKSSRTIIAKEWDTDIQEVIDELNEINPSRLEVTGFSAGGRNVFKLAKAKNPDFVGLIDPSVPESVVKFDKKTDEAIVDIKGLPTDSILLFNNDNWGDIPAIKKRQPALKKAMKDAEMTVVETTDTHMDFPKKFFSDHIK